MGITFLALYEKIKCNLNLQKRVILDSSLLSNPLEIEEYVEIDFQRNKNIESENFTEFIISKQ